MCWRWRIQTSSANYILMWRSLTQGVRGCHQYCHPSSTAIWHQTSSHHYYRGNCIWAMILEICLWHNNSWQPCDCNRRQISWDVTLCCWVSGAPCFKGLWYSQNMETTHPTMQYHIPGDVNPQQHRCENIKCSVTSQSTRVLNITLVRTSSCACYQLVQLLSTVLFELWVYIYIVCEVQFRLSYSMYVGYVNLQTTCTLFGPFLLN